MASGTLSIDTIKRQLQSHLTDGLAIIVGSGLSCAEGLPGMGDLATHLAEMIPLRITESDKELWTTIEPLLFEFGLERAISTPISESLEKEILYLISSYLVNFETQVIKEVILGERELRLTKLLRHVLFNKYLPIITTNYDRLVEIAVEEAGYGVDTFFVGKIIANLDPIKSQLSFCQKVRKPQRGHSPTLEYQKRAIVCKPHGSLDWYIRGKEPISFNWPIPNLDQLIVIPGQNKFRTGYNRPFDLHREKANHFIDEANRFLIIGYGFNDEHLETHLKDSIASGKSTVMLTHSLSKNALDIAVTYSNVIAIDYYNDNGIDGTRIITGKEHHIYHNMQIWDLGNFITEVLEA